MGKYNDTTFVFNTTVNSEIFARVLFSRNFAYNTHELAKSLCRLLILVYHALVANFQRHKSVFYRYSRK